MIEGKPLLGRVKKQGQKTNGLDGIWMLVTNFFCKRRHQKSVNISDGIYACVELFCSKSPEDLN